VNERPGHSDWRPALRVLAGGAVALQALIGAIVLSSVARGEAIGDWVAFYAAGTIVAEGGGSHLYDAAAQHATQAALFGPEAVLNYFPLPPFAAYIFAPFASLSFGASYFAWLAINVATLGVLLVTCWRWLGESASPLRLPFVLLAGVSLPVLSVLMLGQVDLFVVVSFAGCFILLRRDRPVAAGAALALALLKPHLVLAPLLMLAVRREWRALGAFAAAGVTLVVLPALLLGPATLVEWARGMASYPAESTERQINAAMMVNVRGAAVSLTGSESAWLWAPPLALVAGIAIVAAVRAWRRQPATDPHAWAFAFALPLMYSPHLHAQTLVLLVAAAACYLAADARSGATRVREDHLLVGFVLLTALWLLGLAGVALLFVPVLATFTAIGRAWPRTASRRPEEADQPAVELKRAS
jgi:hypothetical protein